MIKLDLRNLTQAHVDEAMPHLKACRYASPCIIGTLIPKDQRASMDHTAKSEDDSVTVDVLIESKLVEFPNEEQAKAAERIQTLFDFGNTEEFLAAVKPWVEAQPS